MRRAERSAIIPKLLQFLILYGFDTCCILFLITTVLNPYERGHKSVASTTVVVKTLGYKPEGREFETR
jgi:hypothetical protein